MTTTTIKKIEIGDLTIILKRTKTAADRIEAFIDWVVEKIEESARPDNTLPGGQGGRPDNTLPGGQGGSPDNTLPGQQPKPEQGLPGAQPGVDNTLPKPGGRPGQALPGAQPGIDNTLPGSQPEVDNELPVFLTENQKEIIEAILKGTPCEAQPKK